jgi:hypothetical protein
MNDKRTSPIMLITAMVAAAGLGVFSPACGSDSMSTAGPGSAGDISATGGAVQVTYSGGGQANPNGEGGSGAIPVGTGGSLSQAGASNVTSSTTPVCTSNITWTRGNNAAMRPGEACITCHATSSEAPTFVVAGTVYPTAHEPADCNGSNSNGSAVVIIKDAAGTAHQIPVDASGNFMLQSAPIPLPYTAQVQVGTATRSMGTAQTNGDCNSCHTVTGANGAPGRIMLP